MNRSSSRKDLRAERLGTTPYARSSLKRSSSWNPLAGLRNLAQSLVGRNDEDKSVSGSEEEWNGQMPEIMRGEDVFTLAAAGGRGGVDFEARASTWRAGRASLRASKSQRSDWGALGLGDTVVEVDEVFESPFFRPKSQPQLLPPPPRDVRPSGSTLALKQFMEDKGVRFGPEDAEVLEGLAQSVRAETMVDRQSNPVRYGGWSAATPSKLLSSKAGDAVHTPGTDFSLGSSAPLGARPPGQRKVTYLGPGMSTRRLSRVPKPARKPILDSLEYSKKRKTDNDTMEIEEAPTPEIAAAASVAAAFNAKQRVTPRSPLVPEVREPSPKKAGDDVLRDLIDETLGPETAKPSLVINPYENLSPAPSGRVTPLKSSLRRSASSRLASSTRASASRGAAEKLASVGTSTRKLSTLEMVSNYKSSRETPATQSTSPEPVMNPGDSLKASTMTPPQPKPVEKPAKLPEPVSFQPLPLPSLSSSTIKSTPKQAKEQPVPEPSAAVAAITAKPPSAPKYNPPAIALGPPPSLPTPAPTPTHSAPTRRVDPSAIYLSAKDSALNVDRAALPFYTFTLPSGSPEPSDTVKEAARARPVSTFTFTMRESSLSSAFLSPTTATAVSSDKGQRKTTSGSTDAPTPSSGGFTLPKQTVPAGQWKCDMCQLTNPDSVKDKCTICETPRPGAAPEKKAAPAAPPAPPAGGFTFGATPTASSASTPASGSGFSFPKQATPAGQWKCDMCQLFSPDSVKDKCTVCETPRPGAAPAPKVAAAPPAPPTGGFTFGKASAPTPPTSGGFSLPKPSTPADQWKCTVCDCVTPNTVDKCVACESPRPGAAPAASAPPAALPAPPTGGFSFGKTSAPTPPAGGFSLPKQSTPTDKWTCPVCDCVTPNDVDKCVACESPRPGAAPAASAPPAALPTPPAGGFSFGGKPSGAPAPPSGGFTFRGFGKPASTSSATSAPSLPGLPAPPTGGFTFGVAASTPSPAPLLKPTGGAGEWTCSSCGLQNPSTATEKCTICEADK